MTSPAALFLLELAATLWWATAPVPIRPGNPALTAEIATADARLFRLYFEGCDPAALATMVTDDFEMFHDKGGRVFTSGKAFVADYATSCEAKKAPDAWRSRRELVAGTLHVDEVPGYGAIEEGEHVFYERRGDGPEKLVGRARFVQVWHKAPDGWRLARVLSYDHKPLEM